MFKKAVRWIGATAGGVVGLRVGVKASQALAQTGVMPDAGKYPKLRLFLDDMIVVTAVVPGVAVGDWVGRKVSAKLP